MKILGLEHIFRGNDSFRRLWRLAQPYLDTRENEIHTRTAVRLASDLMDKEGGEPQVIIPALILHDVGWKRIPEKLQLTAFGPGANAPELNRRHEIEGVKIARGLLQELSFDRSLVCKILAIIDGHDSRKEGLSRNDSLVKDADKLWRYTREGFGIDIKRFGETSKEGLARLHDNMDSWLLTVSGKNMAADLLSRRQKEKDS